VWNRVRRRRTRSWSDIVTAVTFFLADNFNDKREGIRVCLDDLEGSSGFALQLVLPIVIGRVYVAGIVRIWFLGRNRLRIHADPPYLISDNSLS